MRWKRKSVATFVASFLVCLTVVLLPFIFQLPPAVHWMFDLVIHSGLYGSGAAGLPPATKYLESVSNFINGGPLLVIIPVVTAVSTIAIVTQVSLSCL